MRRDAILSEVYLVRIKAIEGLLRVSRNEPQDSSAFREFGAEFDNLSLYYGKARTAKSHSAFGALLRIISALLEWKDATLNALPDGDRFIRSAKARYVQWLNEYGDDPATHELAKASASIVNLNALDDIAILCASVASVPLPIGVYSSPSGITIPHSASVAKPKDEVPAELSVAFLMFQIDGHPASAVHHIAPNEVHDLEIEVRVTRWPAAAIELRLTQTSIEPPASYEFPTFTFERPHGDPPYILRSRGRALLKASQGLQARPFEFKYTAEFSPRQAEQPIAVVGHRTLLIEGLKMEKVPMTGYRTIDRKIIEIRDSLRKSGAISPDELSDCLKLILALSNLAARAVQGNEFPGTWSESEFQKCVRMDLRRSPHIGEDLDEHTHVGGGITDLSYKGIPVELKVHPTPIGELSDCQRFEGQTASYAIAKGKRIGVLCVLDNSQKRSAPLPPENLIGLNEQVSHTSGVRIVTIVIQGNLAKPSSLSR